VYTNTWRSIEFFHRHAPQGSSGTGLPLLA